MWLYNILFPQNMVKIDHFHPDVTQGFSMDHPWILPSNTTAYTVIAVGGDL